MNMETSISSCHPCYLLAACSWNFQTWTEWHGSWTLTVLKLSLDLIFTAATHTQCMWKLLCCTCQMLMSCRGYVSCVKWSIWPVPHFDWDRQFCQYSVAFGLGQQAFAPFLFPSCSWQRIVFSFLVQMGMWCVRSIKRSLLLPGRMNKQK